MNPNAHYLHKSVVPWCSQHYYHYLESADKNGIYSIFKFISIEPLNQYNVQAQQKYGQLLNSGSKARRRKQDTNAVLSIQIIVKEWELVIQIQSD